MEKKDVGFIGMDDYKSEDSIVKLFSRSEIESKISKGIYLIVNDPVVKYFGQIINEPRHFSEHGTSESPMNRYPILHQDKVNFVPGYMLVSNLSIIGCIANDKLITNFKRPSPASSVYIPKSNVVRNLLNVSGEQVLGAIVGYEQDPITVNLTDAIGRKQLGIFGTTGSGKSNTALRVAEMYSNMGWCVIFLDYLGEYVECDKPSNENNLFTKYWDDLEIKPKGNINVKKYQPVSDVRDRKDFIKYTLKTDFLDFGTIQSILCPTGEEAQIRKLYPILTELQEKRIPIHLKTLSDKMAEVAIQQKSDSQASSYWIMKARCDNLLMGKNRLWDNYNPTSSNISSNKMLDKIGIDTSSDNMSDLSPEEMLDECRINVIDFKDVSEVDYCASVLILLKRLYKLKKTYANGGLPKILIMIEEAHIPFNEKSTNRYQKPLNDIARKVYKIGRHYHLNMCVISQRPGDIPDAILSQANTRIIHRLKQKADINKVITGDIENYYSMIPRLDVGEAIIDSIEFKAPLAVKIAPCCSKKIDPYVE